MEKYTLNETPVRTAKNFGINNINIELKIPEKRTFQNEMIITSEMDKIKIEDSMEEELMHSKVGLEALKNKTIKITIKENTIVNDPIILNFDFNDENIYLVDNIKIVMEKGSSANFILKYNADENDKYFHYLKNELIAKEYSKASVIIANMLNDKSDSITSFENHQESNSKVDYIFLELNGKNKISNYYSNLNGDFAENNLKTIYLGTNEDIIDINYNIEVYGKKTKCNIDVQGAINKKAHKNFKGIIDFKQGCINSKGTENENCMILSDEAKSKSLPVLLCKEENVEGNHGVSSGKIDEEKLFYIMTKGISYEDAKKLIVKANFSKIIKSIEDTALQENVLSLIDNNL